MEKLQTVETFALCVCFYVIISQSNVFSSLIFSPLVYGENKTNATTSDPTNTNEVELIDDEPLPNQWQSCWNVELDDETLFCYGAVHWPLTYERYKNAEFYDSCKFAFITHCIYLQRRKKNTRTSWPNGG